MAAVLGYHSVYAAYGVAVQAEHLLVVPVGRLETPGGVEEPPVKVGQYLFDAKLGSRYVTEELAFQEALGRENRLGRCLAAVCRFSA